MKLIALGSNLPHPEIGPPLAVVEAACTALEQAGATILAQSRWYETHPVPVSDQPNFINGVVQVAFNGEAEALLTVMHGIEDSLGRQRSVRNAARIVDLDLLAFEQQLCEQPSLILPHPRLHERRFVLQPIVDIDPSWRHPSIGKTAAMLLQALPPAEPGDTVPIS
ncbi:MAG: 2-amino-4-hydroxy-6-hydroxymethyldihydropteridine diphosphokinase [Pseudomonadota bacterium]